MGNFSSRACNMLRRSIIIGGGCDRDRDWAGLPDELLGSIAERLPMSDLARLRAVCSSWASAAPARPPSASHFPWLMLDECRRGFHSFHSLSDGRAYRFRSTRPENGSSTCVGSRDGRLVVMLEGDTSGSYLVNPVTGARTGLPSLRTLPWLKTFFDVRKTVVSSPGEGPVVAAALIYSLSCCHLAFARAGDEGWTPLDHSCPPSQRIEDVACHGDKFFAVFTGGRVQAFDLSGASPHASRLYGSCGGEDAAPPAHASCHVRLVSSPSSGSLLRVKSEKEVLSGSTTMLSVAMLDVESDCGWTEIRDLGDQSLFLDDKCSLSLSAGDVGDVRRNCVYFVDQVPHSGKIEVGNLRTFDLGKGVIEHFRPRNSSIKDRQRLMSPIWFVPSLL